MYRSAWCRGVLLEGGHRPFEIKKFPECDSDIQQADATHRAAHPSRRNNGLQPVNTRCARSIYQEEVVAPIVETPHALRPPWQHGENETDLQTQDNVENDTELS